MKDLNKLAVIPSYLAIFVIDNNGTAIYILHFIP